MALSLVTANRAPALSLASVFLACLLLVPAVAGTQPGGTVSNVTPTVNSFTTTASSFSNPTTVVFTGSIRDGNGEVDLTEVRVATLSGPATFDESFPTGGASGAEPGTFSGLPGFKVWNSNPTDGIIEFRFQYEFTVNGTYVIRAYARDETGFYNGPANDLTLSFGQKVTVSADPVNAAGEPLGGASWGAWQVSPGAPMVASTNYLKLTNTGSTATQAFTVDLGPTFAGPGGFIAIDNNIRLACTEATGAQTPAELTFAPGAPSPTGSISPSFTAVGNVMYCTYELVNLPQILRDGTYSASFTTIAA